MSELMRIAFIEQTVTRPFGGTRRIVELSNALMGLGHDVTVSTKDGRQPRWIPLRAPVNEWHDLQGAWDLVLFNQSKPEELRLVRKIDARVRAFYVLGWGETRLDEIEEQIRASKPEQTTGVIKSVFDDPGFLVLACSTWIGEHLRDRYREDVVTLLGGINRAHFRRYGKPDPPPLRIYYSGDRRKRKGTPTVEAAIAQMAKATKRKVLSSTYWGKGMAQEAIGRWYSEATIFADGQHWAGWNNPVLEAMACGTPVVCTDIGGVRDFAVEGETALLVPPQDMKAMAGALTRLAESKELRDRLAEAAYQHVQRFRWEDTAARLVEIVRERS